MFDYSSFEKLQKLNFLKIETEYFIAKCYFHTVRIGQVHKLRHVIRGRGVQEKCYSSEAQVRC